jgi:hypothetical protein
VRRPLLAAALCCAALAVAAGSAQAGTAGAAGCRKPFQRTHDRAVFGHFATLAAAKALKKRAAAVGFAGIKIYDNGCGDFDVLIDGADNTADRGSFAAEAQKAGFPVTFEQTAPPLQLRKGYTYGVLGTFTRIAAANALSWKLATVNFRYIEIAYVNGKWVVVMPAVPIRNALSIAAEVNKAGFHIAFNTG